MTARPLVAGLVLALLVLASLGLGAARIGPDAAAGEGWTALVLMESRLPRTLAVLLTGAALAVAGVVIQSLVRNRFVGPDTAGTGESAALGLLAVTLLAPGAPIWVKMVVASLSAMAGTALFLQIVRRLPVREVMLGPIAGLVLSGIIGAVVTWIAWQADLLQFVGTWLMSGEFSGVIAGRYELLWVAGAAAGGRGGGRGAEGSFGRGSHRRRGAGRDGGGAGGGVGQRRGVEGEVGHQAAAFRAVPPPARRRGSSAP